MADPIDPYKILQVDPEAEDEVIQAAYRRLARKYHPDLAAATDGPDRMAAINAAWELIGEPRSRAAYDRARAAASKPATTPDAPASTPPNQPATAGAPPRPTPSPPQQAETVSRDWSAGRSSFGGGFDESMKAADGHGAAGPPPGQPSGTVLNFGRYAGWSLGEVARVDLEYVEWLDRAPIGRNYRQEVDEILRASGRRKPADAEASGRRGLYRRR